MERVLHENGLCTRGGGWKENKLHVFWDCCKGMEVWKGILNSLHNFFNGNLKVDGKKGMLSLRMRIGRPCSCIPEGIFCWHTIKLIYGIQMQSIYKTQNFLADKLVDKIKRAFRRKMIAGWMAKRGLFY